MCGAYSVVSILDLNLFCTVVIFRFITPLTEKDVDVFPSLQAHKQHV